MSLEIRWAPKAERDANRLDLPVRRRIVSALERFGETEHGDIVRLTDVSPPQFRLRVGDWRVVGKSRSSRSSTNWCRVSRFFIASARPARVRFSPADPSTNLYMVPTEASRATG